MEKPRNNSDGNIGSPRLFPQLLLFAPSRQPTSGQTRAHGFFFAAMDGR
jgi:hypothetical protein